MKKPTQLIDIAEVKRRTGFRSTQTVYNKMADAEFPQPIKIGSNSNRWIAAEVEAWIQSLIEESRGIASA